MTDAHVTQLKRKKISSEKYDGGGLEPVTSYTFYDIWPTSISSIDLSYDSSDVIEEFTVEFQVNYWAPADLSGSDKTP